MLQRNYLLFPILLSSLVPKKYVHKYARRSVLYSLLTAVYKLRYSFSASIFAI